MGKTNSHYQVALLEDIDHRLKLVQEALIPLKNVASDISHMKKRMDKFDGWKDLAELVIKDQSKTLNAHETRLTKLETA